MAVFPTQGARPVWIASYPRSGNTFLRILLEKVFQMPSYSVYYVEGATHRDPSAEALDDAPKLPINWRELLTESHTAPLVAIKTHDLPLDAAPAIFVARDGRAAIDSYFHYHQKFAFEQPSLTEVIAGACQFGSWSEHYWGWKPKIRPKTLLLMYDELVSAPERVVDKVAKFLNLSPAVAQLPAFSELQRKLPAFFRRGQNADYRTEWSGSQKALFNELHSSAMQDLGFALEPADQPVGGVVKELAQSAARLHRLYLEELTKMGWAKSEHQSDLKRITGLENQMGEISESLRQTKEMLRILSEKRWIRLGVAVGAVPPPIQTPRAPLHSSSAGEAPAFKPSAGSTQSS